MRMKKLILEKLRVGYRIPIAKVTLMNANVEIIRNHIADQIVYAISASVLADRVEPSHYTFSLDFDHYASWWQACKAVHFPTLSRWTRRPPRLATTTKTRVIQAKNYATFPENTRVYPEELGPVVKLQIWE